MNSDRRDFIKKSAVVTAGIGVAPALLNACEGSPSDKICVALIGCRSMGFSNLMVFLEEKNVECLGLCDVDSKVLEEKASEVEKITQKRPPVYKDFRKVLENPDINTVIIGTPDHWHAIIMMMALEAGKHVYVEKPMGHSIEECQLMVEAASKYPGQVVQVGMWQRSAQHWFDASEVVRSGELGNVNLVKAWIYKGYDFPIKPETDTETPTHIDYDMWLGPAPQKAFNKNRFHYNFRWFWDYAGGAMTDWGVHLLDFADYAMGAAFPSKVSPGGGIYNHEKGVIETPDIQQAIYTYPTHSMVWECGLNPAIGPYGTGHGVAFVGTRGTLILTRNGWQVYAETRGSDKEPWIKAVKKEGTPDGLKLHVKNFLKCIRKGGKVNAPVEVGAKAGIIAEMGNIAYRVGEVIHWDEKAMKFKEEAANKLTKVSYRNQWKLPAV